MVDSTAHTLTIPACSFNQEAIMVRASDSESQNRVILGILAIVGAVLCVVGWYRWVN